MPDRDEGRALWSRLKAAQAAPAEPAALDLAVYAEGTADAATRDRVEAFLALSPDAVDWVMAARVEVQGRSPGWGRVVTRGRALVAPVHRFHMRDAAQWSAVAASLLVVAVLGFELGRGIDGSWMEPGGAIDTPGYGLIDSRDPLFVLAPSEEG